MLAEIRQALKIGLLINKNLSFQFIDKSGQILPENLEAGLKLSDVTPDFKSIYLNSKYIQSHHPFISTQNLSLNLEGMSHFYFIFFSLTTWK